MSKEIDPNTWPGFLSLLMLVVAAIAPWIIFGLMIVFAQ